MNRLRVTGGASGRGGVQPRQADRDQLRGMIQGSAETHFVHYLPTPNHQPRSPPDPQLRGEAAAQPLDPGHMDQSRLGNQKLLELAWFPPWTREEDLWGLAGCRYAGSDWP